MTRQRVVAIGLSLVLLAVLSPLIFQVNALSLPRPGATKEGCRERVVRELTSVVDEYRSVVFGTVKGTDGKIYAKTNGEVLRERIGILETKKRLTSELVEPLIESYRALRCKVAAVCETVSKSLLATGDASIMVQQLGCEDEPKQLYRECRFAGEGAQIAATEMSAECARLTGEMLTMEQSVLKTAVAYDSGYRSLLQFSGMTEAMLKDMPTRNFLPVRSMVNMLGKLYQIPCFSGQCDMPSNDDLKP